MKLVGKEHECPIVSYGFYPRTTLILGPGRMTTGPNLADLNDYLNERTNYNWDGLDGRDPLAMELRLCDCIAQSSQYLPAYHYPVYCCIDWADDMTDCAEMPKPPDDIIDPVL